MVMKNPFAEKKKKSGQKDDPRMVEKIERSTAEIEAEKAAKKHAREEKKFLKLHAEKRKKWERLVAPVVLFLTILLSYFIWLRSR